MKELSFKNYINDYLNITLYDREQTRKVAQNLAKFVGCNALYKLKLLLNDSNTNLNDVKHDKSIYQNDDKYKIYYFL